MPGAAAWLAGAAWLASTVWAVPQLVRVLRTRSVAGVSAVSQVLALAGTAGFGAYGLLTGSLALVASRPLTLVSSTMVLWLVVRADPSRRGPVLVAGAVAAAGMVSVVVSPEWLAAWCSVLVVLPVVPQALEVRRSDDVAGVSVATWVLAAATDALWAGYGLVDGRPGLVWPLVLGVPPTAYVVVTVLARRRS